MTVGENGNPGAFAEIPTDYGRGAGGQTIGPVGRDAAALTGAVAA